MPGLLTWPTLTCTTWDLQEMLHILSVITLQQGSCPWSSPFGICFPPKFKILSGKFKRRSVWECQNNERRLTIEFGHSKGTFTIEKFWGPIIRVPSELPNCKRGVHESRFVVFVTLKRQKAFDDWNLPFQGHFYYRKILRTNNKSAPRIAKL